MTLIPRLTTHYLLQGLGQGILLSVITLFMVEKGMSLWQIGFAFGTFGLSAALFELPLGATADLHGRIRVFRISQRVSIAGLLIGAFASEFLWILPAMICMGLARALESGSVSAWEVEQIHKQGMKERLSELLGRFQAFNALGIAAGALLGGYLPGWFGSLIPTMPPTTINLFTIAALTAVHILLLPILFHEGDLVSQPEQRPTVMGQIKTAVDLASGNRALRSVLLIGFVLGLVMSNMEAYWQPQLKSLLQDQGYELFGWMATGYFVSAAFGPALFSMLSARLNLSAHTSITMLLALVAPLLWLLADSRTIPAFAVFYCLFIAVLVCINIPVQVLTNEHTTDALRSTVHSVVSLTLQLGGALSAFGFSILIDIWGIAPVWQSIALGLLLFAALRQLNGWRHRTGSAVPQPSADA